MNRDHTSIIYTTYTNKIYIYLYVYIYAHTKEKTLVNETEDMDVSYLR